MPCPARQIFVQVKIAEGQNVEALAFLIANHNRQRILKLLAKSNILHTVSICFPHMLTSNHRGRGNEPVVVLGRIWLAVAVNIRTTPARHSIRTNERSGGKRNQ